MTTFLRNPAKSIDARQQCGISGYDIRDTTAGRAVREARRYPVARGHRPFGQVYICRSRRQNGKRFRRDDAASGFQQYVWSVSRQTLTISGLDPSRAAETLGRNERARPMPRQPKAHALREQTANLSYIDSNAIFVERPTLRCIFPTPSRPNARDDRWRSRSQ